jgi:hypothetical protein
MDFWGMTSLKKSCGWNGSAVSVEMSEHVCQPSKGCTCYLLASEPAEDCPQHGYPVPRCDCGRFVALARQPTEPYCEYCGTRPCACGEIR